MTKEFGKRGVAPLPAAERPKPAAGNNGRAVRKALLMLAVGIVLAQLVVIVQPAGPQRHLHFVLRPVGEYDDAAVWFEPVARPFDERPGGKP